METIVSGYPKTGSALDSIGVNLPGQFGENLCRGLGCGTPTGFMAAATARMVDGLELKWDGFYCLAIPRSYSTHLPLFGNHMLSR